MPRLKEITGKMLQVPKNQKSQKKITIKLEQTSECSIGKRHPSAMVD